jgi:streptogramin lyase
MIARPLIVSFALLACVSGCTQASAPLPGAVARSTVSSVTGPRNAHPTVRFFNTPTAGAWPDYIVAGPQGALWFSEFYTDRIGRVATDGTITEFPLPDSNDIEGIAAGADGNIWFTEPGANQIGRMTPGGSVTAFPIKGDNPSPRGITQGPDGNIWYVEYYDGYIGRVTPAGVITRFAIPDASSFPWDITTGPDGDLWFSESADNRIGRFDPRKLVFKSPLTVPTQFGTPWGVLLGPDKHIWFTERRGDKLAVVSNGNIGEFSIAQPGSYPEKIAADSAGHLWFTEMQAGNVGVFDRRTGKFGGVIALPSGSIPIGIATGPDQNIWFTIASYSSQSQIGEIVLH